MRRPAFSDVFALLAGLWVSVAVAYGLAWKSARDMQSLPARLSAESVGGFKAIYFAKTRQAYPPSGTQETLDGVRWTLRYGTAAATADGAAGPTTVTLLAESIPERHRAEYSFQRIVP